MPREITTAKDLIAEASHLVQRMSLKFFSDHPLASPWHRLTVDIHAEGAELRTTDGLPTQLLKEAIDEMPRLAGKLSSLSDAFRAIAPSLATSLSVDFDVDFGIGSKGLSCKVNAELCSVNGIGWASSTWPDRILGNMARLEAAAPDLIDIHDGPAREFIAWIGARLEASSMAPFEARSRRCATLVQLCSAPAETGIDAFLEGSRDDLSGVFERVRIIEVASESLSAEISDLTFGHENVPGM